MSEITVFAARKLRTMDRNRPEATHVAVRDGRVLAVGALDEVAGWGAYRLDDRFADKVILPGLVEGHAHILAGGIWSYVYCGHHERIDPWGKAWPGLGGTAEVIAQFRREAAKLDDAETPLIGWGFDPIFLDGPRLSRDDLDRVSKTRPIAVIHSNFHLLTANSAALALARYDRNTDVAGVRKRDDGELHGELWEIAAMFPVMRRLNIDFADLSRAEDGIRAYGQVARRCGVTTVTDLFAELTPEDVDQLLAVTGEDDFPIRLVPALNALTRPAAEVARRALEIRRQGTDKLRLGIVKIMTDGTIQGFTAQVKAPFYYKAGNHGIWNIAPAQLHALVGLLHDHGIQMHIHTNGDLASEVTLDAIEAALARKPRGDHRHTLQHAQLAPVDQFRRMKALGICANLFANHIYYFGDKHRDITVGPDRARRMNACRDALDCGVPLAIHSDAPVTPMGPLFGAWCAVNRKTASGQVLGEAQRITVEEALHAITLGAAYTLKMDHEVGSIATGKRADFCVLEEDPLEVGAEGLKDISVVTTVIGGRVNA